MARGVYEMDSMILPNHCSLLPKLVDLIEDDLSVNSFEFQLRNFRISPFLSSVIPTAFKKKILLFH